MMLKMHEYDFMQSRVLERRVWDTHSCSSSQWTQSLAVSWLEHLEDLRFVESEPSIEDDSFFFSLSLSFSCNMASGHHYTPPPPLLCDLEESGRERPEVDWMHWVANWQRAEGFAINVVRRTRVNIHVCSWAALSSFIQALHCPWFKRLPSSDVTACKLCYFLCFIHGWHQI